MLGRRLGVLAVALSTSLVVTVPALTEARTAESPLAAPSEALAELEQASSSYEVQPGDTLYALARANGLTVEQIATLNGLLDPDLIRVGQVLALPNSPSAPRVSAAAMPATYMVQPGDTLYSLAGYFDVPLASLVAWNEIADPDQIAAGTRLVLNGRMGRGSGSVTLKSVADWMGSPNYWPGRPSGQPIALVLHTMGGTIDGAMGEFANPFSNASSHYGIGLDGRVDQYVDLGDRAWANGILEPGSIWPGPAGVSPNELTVSIETEDLGNADQPVTDAQYQATLKVGRLVLGKYPSIRYLVTHRAISPQSRPNDPGPRWYRGGRLNALANALGLKLIP